MTSRTKAARPDFDSTGLCRYNLSMKQSSSGVKTSLLAKHCLGHWLPLTFMILSFCFGCSQPNTPAPTSTALVPDITQTRCQAVLELGSLPSGASITIDGEWHGALPRTLQLEPGRYHLEASMTGLITASQVVSLDCGPSSILLQLEDTTPPTLSIESMPTQVSRDAGLKVVARATDPSGLAHMALYLDDSLIHETTEASLRANLDTRLLAEGTHRILLTASDRADNQVEKVINFAIVDPSATPDTAQPTVSVPPLPDPTIPVAPTLTPIPSPVIVRQQVVPVEVFWDEITVPTYRYEQALYRDDEAGHPYPLLHRDRVGSPEPRVYRVLIMRNEYLELTLLPELGGRIYQCRFLPTGQTLFYNNKVIKPTHWGPQDQGWWLAIGGLEFCLPVDEHGYLTAQPWEMTIEQGSDGSATAIVSINERTRSLDAQVAIGLRPGHSRFTLDSRITNRSTTPQSLQYWINGMLAPGAESVSPTTRFYYPTDEMIVHSTGDQSLPSANERMPWPLYNGRDYGTYESWHDWLGIFATELRSPYTAVYDPETEIGLVRVFPDRVARGVKLFGFGRGFGDARAYTDDGSQYIEMWGGWTPTFWDYESLAAGQVLTWQETWYPVAHMDGIAMATEDLALSATRQDQQIICDLASTRSIRGVCQLVANNQIVVQQAASVKPERTEHFGLTIPAGNTQASLAVRIVDDNNRLLIEQPIAP